MERVLVVALRTSDAVAILLKADLVSQALVVIYSAIDTMAWANKPAGDVQRMDFIAWANSYMQPQERLGCTAEDLYAARCALLHSGTADSAMSRDGKAVPLWYVTGAASKPYLEQKIAVENETAKVLSVVDLLAAFVEGTYTFTEALNQDVARREQVAGRIQRWLGFVPVRQIRPKDEQP